MKKVKKILLAIVPEYSLFPLVFAVLFNFTVYYGSRVIAGSWQHYNIESRFDDCIPFWPPSVVIYFGSYLFWIVNYILIARQGKKEVCQFFSCDFLSRTACFACYLLFPTTNTRPVVQSTGFFNQIMTFLYSIDAADNLFPSIHCLVSWLCYIGLRDRRDVPVWYRRGSCFMAILICISTLTTKQHVIWDVAGGILLAEICFRLGKKQTVWRTYQKLTDKVYGVFFRKGTK